VKQNTSNDIRESDFPVPGCDVSFSRQPLPEFCKQAPTFKRRRRKRRMRGAPAASCAAKKAHELETTGSPEHRRFLRNGFNGFLRALLGDRAFLSQSSARCQKNLGHHRQLAASVEASGPHDFAVRFSAVRPRA